MPENELIQSILLQSTPEAALKRAGSKKGGMDNNNFKYKVAISDLINDNAQFNNNSNKFFTNLLGDRISTGNENKQLDGEDARNYDKNTVAVAKYNRENGTNFYHPDQIELYEKIKEELPRGQKDGDLNHEDFMTDPSAYSALDAPVLSGKRPETIEDAIRIMSLRDDGKTGKIATAGTAAAALLTGSGLAPTIAHYGILGGAASLAGGELGYKVGEKALGSIGRMIDKSNHKGASDNSGYLTNQYNDKFESALGAIGGLTLFSPGMKALYKTTVPFVSKLGPKIYKNFGTKGFHFLMGDNGSADVIRYTLGHLKPKATQTYTNPSFQIEYPGMQQPEWQSQLAYNNGGIIKAGGGKKIILKSLQELEKLSEPLKRSVSGKTSITKHGRVTFKTAGKPKGPIAYEKVVTEPITRPITVKDIEIPPIAPPIVPANTGRYFTAKEILSQDPNAYMNAIISAQNAAAQGLPGLSKMFYDDAAGLNPQKDAFKSRFLGGELYKNGGILKGQKGLKKIASVAKALSKNNIKPVELTGDLFSTKPSSMFTSSKALNPRTVNGFDPAMESASSGSGLETSELTPMHYGTSGVINRTPEFGPVIGSKTTILNVPSVTKKQKAIRTPEQKHESFMKGLDTYTNRVYGMKFENIKKEYKPRIEAEYRSKFENKKKK